MLNSKKAKLWDPFSALPMRFSTSKGIILPVPSFPGFQVGSVDERHWQKTGVEEKVSYLQLCLRQLLQEWLYHIFGFSFCQAAPPGWQTLANDSSVGTGCPL